AQHDSGWRAGEGDRRGGLPRALTRDGSVVLRDGRLSEIGKGAAVDVAEIKKLDAYLKQQFGNARIHVVPKSADNADVFVGEDRIGNLVVDDEDGERSYNFEMKLLLGEPVSIKSLKALEVTLRKRFDNENIRVVARPRKTDSAEVCIG